MLTEIKVRHVNGLKEAKVKFGEMGDLSHILTFDVLLDPGDLERVLIPFKQRIPVTLMISSPQSKMDLKGNLISDTTTEEEALVDSTTLGEVKEGLAAPEEGKQEEPVVVAGGKRGRGKR